MGKSRAIKVNANCNQVILDHFWNVCDVSEEKRIKSVQVILKTLSHQLSSNQNSDIDYCIQRLVRGLVSTREFSRHGFCVLLTQILMNFSDQINVTEVIEVAEKEFGSNLDNCLPENVIAWILFVGCLIKSKIIKQDSSLLIIQIFDILYNLGSRKNYVEVMVCNLMPLLFDVVQNEFTFESVLLNKIENYEKENKNLLFFVYLVLLSYKKYPTVTKPYFDRLLTQKVFKLNSKDYGKIVSLLKESTKYFPNLHPINELLIKTILEIDSKNASLFLSKIVEDLFKVNLEKTSLGFDVVCILLKHCNENQISCVLSTNFMRIFIQTLSNKKHPLHNKAIQLGDFFVQYSSDIRHNSSQQIALAKCFIEKPGSINFDELSKSKILLGILKNFSNESIRKWVLLLKDIMQTSEDVPTSDFIRIRCLQQITHLLKSYTENDTFLQSFCKFLFIYAYFDVSTLKKLELTEDICIEKFKSLLSDKLQKSFPDSFKTTLAHIFHLVILNINSPAIKLQKQIEVLTLMNVFIDKFISRKKVKLLSVDDSSFENIKNPFQAMKLNVERIDNLSDTSVQAFVFKFIYLHFMIALFDDSKEIINSLPDLDECMNRALFVKSKQKRKSSDNPGEPLWSDVLTDLFLSLLATKSKHTKNVIVTAFRHVSPFLSNVGVQSLTDAILNNDTFDMDVSDEEEEDEDVEMQNVDHQDGSGQEKSDVSSDEEDDEDLVVSDDAEVDEQFRNDIVQALGNAVDGDDDSEGVSDTEMMKLDESLAEVFRKKFGNKKRESERQNMIQNFKHRVLELIQILIDTKEMTPDIAFLLLSSVVTFIKPNYAVKNMSSLTNKCTQILIQISKIKLSPGSVSEDEIKEMLKLLNEFQHKCTNSELQKALVSVTSWLLTVAHDQLGEVDFFKGSIAQSLKDFFEKSNVELKANLFTRLIPQLIELENDSFPDTTFYQTLVSYSFKEDIRSFKRCSALDILCGLFKLNSTNQQEQPVLVKLAIQLLSQLINELDHIAGNKSNDATTKNKEPRLQYINLLIRLMIILNVWDFKNQQIDKLKEQISTKVDSLSKEFRKKLDKRFVKKFRTTL